MTSADLSREGGTLSGGGIQATGNYPGKARTLDELRQDLDKALALIPGKALPQPPCHIRRFQPGKAVPRNECSRLLIFSRDQTGKAQGLGI